MRTLPVLVALLMLIAGGVGVVASVGGVAESPVEDDPIVDAAVGQTNVGSEETVDRTNVGSEETVDRTNGSDEVTLERLEEVEPGGTFRVLATPPGATVTGGSTLHDANLGTTMELDVNDVDAAMKTEVVRRHVENAETDDDRQRRILAEMNRIERDEERLHERQSDAVDAHANGELSDRELLDELIRIAAIADEYDERLDALDDLAAETEGVTTPDRLDELQIQLEIYEGPVREEALDAVRGETGGSEIHVETSQDAVVLAMIDEGADQYVREVIRDDRWDRGGGEITSDRAINVTAESYPETTALREPDAFGAGAVHRVTVDHEFGELRTFVSGGTDQVFVEQQRIDLAEFADFEPVNTVGDGFNVTVDRSYAGGPVVVSVADAGDEEPVEGVTVTKSIGGGDSEAIGTTDADGTVRTLSPAEAYRITVVDEPQVAVINGIEPTEIPRLTDDQQPEETEDEGS
ncbi:DUF7096 domain-containing protein [Halorubrum vacuolatum]|nr:hypothetical protein [Halorubrum vacuolatum]